MKSVATLWGVWALWVWMCVALSGCVTSKTAQYDPATGNLVFISQATGTGSNVAEAQKALRAVNADGSGVDMTAGVKGLDSSAAMIAGMEVSRDIFKDYMAVFEKLERIKLENPQPDSDPLDFLSSEERTRLLDFLTTRAGSP
ncbi:MAG: hypothetical protein V3U60_16180 [Gammaproteobacteria bacterium]